MPELNWATVFNWLITHGILILIIVVVGAVLWFALNKSLPPIVRRSVARTKYKESKEGLEKRTNTLISIFKGMGRVLIIIVAIMMILDEVGGAVATVRAGFGIAGVALGFGRQYLINDLIARR